MDENRESKSTRRDSRQVEVISEQREDGIFEIKFQSREIKIDRPSPDSAGRDLSEIGPVKMGGGSSAAIWTGLALMIVLMGGGVWFLLISPHDSEIVPPNVINTLEPNQPMTAPRGNIRPNLGDRVVNPQINRDAFRNPVQGDIRRNVNLETNRLRHTRGELHPRVEAARQGLPSTQAPQLVEADAGLPEPSGDEEILRQQTRERVPSESTTMDRRVRPASVPERDELRARPERRPRTTADLSSSAAEPDVSRREWEAAPIPTEPEYQQQEESWPEEFDEEFDEEYEDEYDEEYEDEYDEEGYLIE